MSSLLNNSGKTRITIRIIRLVIVFFIALWAAFLFLSRKQYDYQRAGQGVYYNLHSFSDQAVKIVEGDFLTLNLSYSTADDSVFFRGMRKFRLINTGQRGSLNNLLLRFASGDSVSVLIKAGVFYAHTLRSEIPPFLSQSDFMKINFRITGVQSAAQFEEEKMHFLQWASGLEAGEKEQIRRFLNNEKLEINPLPSGLRFLKLTNGGGARVENGRRIRIHYEGRFLNGEFLESTREQSTPLDFVYGEEYIVLPGIAEALGFMSAGDKALVILPSGLAFGESGSVEGIVPPYTGLVYELEVISVE
jgi:FKBP-type peptidyl-prolyl cis-trans isomerase